MILELVFSFSVILGPILPLRIGGPATVKTFYLDSSDCIDVEQAEFLGVDFIKNDFVPTKFSYLF